MCYFFIRQRLSDDFRCVLRAKRNRNRPASSVQANKIPYSSN